MRKSILVALLALGLMAVGCGDDDEVTTPPAFGTIEVVTVTTGLVIDGDGYTITVSSGDDERTENIGANSSVTLSNLTAGTKSLLLGDIALNCQTTNNPRNVEVVAGQTTPAQFDVTCAVPNLPPVADAGPDQSVVDADNSGSEAVTLDGSGSVDADGTIVSWSWSVNGLEVGTGETLDVAAHAGIHTVTLTVTDDEGATDTDDVTITVQLPTIAGVAIFEFDDFDGDGFMLRRDFSDLGNLPGPCGVTDTWDDCISSILLSGGWSVILFEFDGFEGDSLIVETSRVDMDDSGIDWDNRTSSIKVRPPN